MVSSILVPFASVVVVPISTVVSAVAASVQPVAVFVFVPQVLRMPTLFISVIWHITEIAMFLRVPVIPSAASMAIGMVASTVSASTENSFTFTLDVSFESPLASRLASLFVFELRESRS